MSAATRSTSAGSAPLPRHPHLEDRRHQNAPSMRSGHGRDLRYGPRSASRAPGPVEAETGRPQLARSQFLVAMTRARGLLPGECGPAREGAHSVSIRRQAVAWRGDARGSPGRSGGYGVGMMPPSSAPWRMRRVRASCSRSRRSCSSSCAWLRVRLLELSLLMGCRQGARHGEVGRTEALDVTQVIVVVVRRPYRARPTAASWLPTGGGAVAHLCNLVDGLAGAAWISVPRHGRRESAGSPQDTRKCPSEANASQQGIAWSGP